VGASLEAVRNQIEEILGPGGDPPAGHIPFTPRAKAVLELSLREALRLGDLAIGPSHVLLGLLREGQGVACQALLVLGVDLERLRDLAEDVADERSTERAGRSPASTIAIDDAQTVLTTLRDALGEDVRIHQLSVASPNEIRAAVRAGGGGEASLVIVVLRDGRWSVEGRS
jgi:ATP-dependent Clp protease ATP-binding subunit ClpA